MPYDYDIQKALDEGNINQLAMDVQTCRELLAEEPARHTMLVRKETREAIIKELETWGEHQAAAVLREHTA